MTMERDEQCVYCGEFYPWPVHLHHEAEECEENRKHKTVMGISVECTLCGHTKKPHGRDAPMEATYCDESCPGYEIEPKPGCLWPGETEEDFGFTICRYATKIMPKTDGLSES